ncbi:c-type cytochrome [Shimia sagamensis]|uniref:Sulfur dehydrogenase subunit SoxD n=1 Tax=Shimia sagamensis TaxID=1566352 RepID=A0ABY1PKS5_9RHOB|nr:c-type cytochrome [Shimia sagamensis]SMP35351.1 sulfur dehydrogenase subunit SoxD [Shimia sagamensis]
MSKFLKSTALTVVIAMVAGPVVAEKFGLGRMALPEEITAWDGDISPDGMGLPVGSGDALDGEEIFADKCASCHGDFAEGIDNWPKLAGGADTLNHDDPLKTVGSYWPYLTTTFDYIKRSMPYGNAGSLSDDEVYAMVAYILYSNDLVEDDFVLSNETFLDVDMPNANGFIIDDRAETEYPAWTGEPCMQNCKNDVVVTMRALVLDVTPTQNNAAKTPEANEVEAAGAEVEAEIAKPTVINAELAAAGKKVFKKCKACHQVGEGAKNRTGPILTNIVDGAAGAVDGFKYSKPMKKVAEAGLVWNDAELSAFLAKPKAYMKGTKMSFAGLKKEADQRALIEYLRSFDE